AGPGGTAWRVLHERAEPEGPGARSTGGAGEHHRSKRVGGFGDGETAAGEGGRRVELPGFLLGLDRYVLIRCAPFDVEFGGVSFGVLEGDGHVFLRRRRWLGGHRRPAEVIAFGIGDAPFAGLLADDEEPLVFVGK